MDVERSLVEVCKNISERYEIHFVEIGADENHVYLIFRSINGQNPELLIGDLKRCTSQSIVKSRQENPKESRKEFLLDFFKREA